MQTRCQKITARMPICIEKSQDREIDICSHIF